MALKGPWKLQGVVEVSAKVIVASHNGGARQGRYTGLIEVRDPEGIAVLQNSNVSAPYIPGYPGDRLCYWTLQYRNPKLTPDDDSAGDPPAELIKALQKEDAEIAEAQRVEEARAILQAEEARNREKAAE